MAKLHQFSDGEHRSVVGIAQATAPIICLPDVRRPLAIARFVIAIVVNSFDSMFVRRALAHIGKKVQKRLAPSIAYRNAPTAVIGKMFISGVVAAASHIAPHQEFWGVSSPVDSSSFAGRLAAKTAAGPRPSVFQTFYGNRFFLAAVAAAKPAWMFFVDALFARSKSDQAAKSVVWGNRHASMYHNELGATT